MRSSKMALQDLRHLAASCNDFRQFCSICEQIEERWGLHPALKVNEINFSTSQFKSSQVDEISRRIIPSNLGLSYVPVRSTGDGNCLFNSASLALCQNESLAIELRLRTCFELANNREFYKKHPVLVNTSVTYHGRGGPGVMSVETLCDLTCFASNSSNVYVKHGFEAAFNNEIMRTANNWSYSGTLQIMALASVLGVPIETIYPDQNDRLLPVYQNVFHPRHSSNPADSAVVRILWTNTSGWPDRSKEFVVNHFVPLFKWNSGALRGKSTTATNTKTTTEETTEETVNPWHVVTRKRRSKGQTEKQKSGKQSNKKTKANDQNTNQQQNRCNSGNAKDKAGKQDSQAPRKNNSNGKQATECKDANNREGENPSNSGNWTGKKESQTCEGDRLKIEKEKQSPIKTKVNADDTSIKHTSGNSKNAKAGTEQRESKQTESHENIPGKQVHMEETKEKQDRVDSQDYFPSNGAIQFIKDRSALPFPGASRRFYAGQNKKANKNTKRTRQREQLPVISETKKLIGKQRTRVDGSLDQNIETMKGKLLLCKNNKRKAELQAIIDVADELKQSVLLETSTAAKIYQKRKASLLNQTESTYFCPVDTYEKLSKQLNIVQVYIDQKAFIAEGKDTDIRKVVEIVNNRLAKVKDGGLNNIVRSKLKDDFKDILQFLDSKRDRDVLEAIVAKITSVKNTVSIKGIQFKGGVSGHRATLESKLKHFTDIKVTSQTVRNDMTVSRQHAHVQRKTKQSKEKDLKTIAEGRGRKLKCEEFPELARYIEYCFGEGDRVLRGGGGLQADPRLLDTKLFKAADNATVMRHVKEMFNTIKPGFAISTSCLYTYTKNYKKGTIQAKRHHHGKDVNANVSLHKAPNTSEKVHPLNAHWTSAHVNYLVDSAAENPKGFFLDSKDAKCIVCGDIAPVLKPGKTWRNFETPDHTFDQSRVNAVTPMTHLFMDIKNEPEINSASLLIPQTDVVVNVTRTGKAVTLVNVSFAELETVFRVFNELFLLMCIPSLDKFFRNQETGKLKEIMGFIVDNGPSEAPSNLLVQMLLVRFLKFLDLDKVTQRSFAEYLSKRNFVE